MKTEKEEVVILDIFECFNKGKMYPATEIEAVISECGYSIKVIRYGPNVVGENFIVLIEILTENSISFVMSDRDHAKNGNLEGVYTCVYNDD